MNLTIVFFLGFIVTALATLPPGLLNMNAAKIALKEGHNRGVMFSLGACTIVVFQVLIATVFARYLSNHPDIVDILQRVAFVIFVLISVYFLFIAKNHEAQPKEINVKSKSSRFFQGVFLSSINVFPIPFQAYMAITFSSFGWLAFDKTSIASYVTGSTSGAFVILYIYMFFFEKIKGKSFTSQKNMNYIIGGITGIIAIVTLINIIKEL
ncbi:lysine transporter LysE [Mangrovimonas yunxiaonensis]|uniref:Lysine transporter LysE n=1 Tax=Mangrovimonas yunxiaonensis TaxID=1197477 RepID=A0A084TLH7_9FLAO|nr:lysine transporter LysE [Mangrovimonas yunxiaonensis]KFB01563.1 lysine transporter LysE [Mangrovimonas yunxiaonensis]MBR9756824.1 lysine transporter LysE [Algicola sp.]GGH35943.1 lysine transporter LysE [Mangrovimonas yunxiaonensis]